MENDTQSIADLFGIAEARACQGVTVRVSDNASPLRGDDSMEVYLR
jgi:hypothetical protein